MSIVRLVSVTCVGFNEDRQRLLQGLQDLGCLQIVPLTADNPMRTVAGATAESREALYFLRDYPHRRRQSKDIARFDALAIERQTLAVRQRLQALTDERDFLIKRIQDMRPWGDFVFSPLPEMANLRLWFYQVPHGDMAKVRALPLIYEVVKKDNRFSFVVAVSETEPHAMPVNRTLIGARPRAELEARLEEVELAIEDTQADRAYLTRWYTLLRQNIAALEDQAALQAAEHSTYSRHDMFALRGWAPFDRLKQIKDYARQHGVHVDVKAAQPEDKPPTCLHNPSWLAAGEDLVNFYMTPGYRTWDPSPVVFISFALFFGMILADAGYALLLGALLLFFWRTMGQAKTAKRLRPLCAAIVFCSLSYGMLIGSYFGMTPAQDSPLAKLHLLDMSDSGLMMKVSVYIGCLHVILAAAMDAARHERRIEGLASVGWACIVTAGMIFLTATTFAPQLLKQLAVAFAVSGAALVLLFTAPFEKPLLRLAKGLLGLTKLSGAFGDVLSYLRLFALGLASGSLAFEFNDMARGIYHAMPGIGLFFAILVLLLGHLVNLLLGLTSAVIHGLRLNVIEFFNWGLKEEGTPFNPFRRTER
ncbi:MAG: V-type ATP synthase subunit I [Gammaproteobacteria bacterium]